MKIYQSYTGTQQQGFLSPDTLPYDYRDNPGTEYEIFKTLHRELGDIQEPWGVLSWKFELKTHISVAEFKAQAQQAFDNGAQCVFVNPMISAESVFTNVWEQGIVTGHSGIEALVPFLMERGYLRMTDLFMPRSTFALCNYFVAKPAFWARYFDYVDAVLLDLEEEARNGTPVGVVYAGSGHYGRQPGLSMKPFIVERLLSGFIAQSGLPVHAIELSLPTYKHKFGNLLGNTLHRLSVMKNEQDPAKMQASRSRWLTLSKQLLQSRAYRMAIPVVDDPAAEIALLGLSAA